MQAIVVAPYTGAWIETNKTMFNKAKVKVAPYTGAWIETPIPKGRFSSTDSSPLHGGVD